MPLLLGALWLLAVLSGSLLLAQYSHTAGASATPPDHWPSLSPRPGRPGAASLVLFLHPHCPCSRATLGELERLMACCQGLVTTRVWFICPDGHDEKWAKTDLWRTAAAIPQVDVQVDHHGREARLFQAMTSGQTLLYDAGGRLLFQGGITPARGHAGDNTGSDAIESLLKHRTSDSTSTPVFGCTLSRDQKTEECSACQQ